MTTFTAPVNPTYGSTQTIKRRVLTTQFGDGYTQRTGDGLNTIIREWSLRWENLPKADTDTIENFFLALADGESFDWTPPESVTSYRWVIKDDTWTRSKVGFETETFTITFQQNFDNA